MKTYCETFGHWLYHPVDTSIVCDNRAKSVSECRRCRGIDPSKVALPRQRESVPKMIMLNLGRNAWVEAVRQIKEEYGIHEGPRQDETSARRIAMLLGELYLSGFHQDNSNDLFNVTVVEEDVFDLAIENRLTCDLLEREQRVKPNLRKQVLCTWGVDKASGMEGHITQLKEWTIEALLGIPQISEKGEEEHGPYRKDGPRRSFDFGERPTEGIGLEEAGIG